MHTACWTCLSLRSSSHHLISSYPTLGHNTSHNADRLLYVYTILLCRSALHFNPTETWLRQSLPQHDPTWPSILLHFVLQTGAKTTLGTVALILNRLLSNSTHLVHGTAHPLLYRGISLPTPLLNPFLISHLPIRPHLR
jgi:hypothetical protein